MHKTQFFYHNNNSPGVFSYLKQNSLNFTLFSKDRYPQTTWYCDNPVMSENVSCLVDGRNDTAWRNIKSENSYFTIDFDINHFFLTDYVLKKVCNQILPWKIEGSNDYINWYGIVTHGPMPESQNEAHYHIDNPHFPYHYFKFSLLDSDEDFKIIHLSNIEFYGVLDIILKFTQHSKIHICYSFFINSLSFIK